MNARTIFVLVAFAVLLTVNKISLHKDIKEQNSDLSVVNISGRQRMYSQKLTKLAVYKIDNFKKPKINNTLLETTLANFSNAHKELKSDLNKYDNEILNYLYIELEPSYTKLSTNVRKLILEDTDSLKATNLVVEIKIAESEFLPKMNEIVNSYEIIGINRGKMILEREFTFNLILLFLAIYTVFVIVFPMINKPKKT